MTGAAVPFGGTRCKYRMVDTGELEGVGFADGLTLKRPCSYTKGELLSILEAQSAITFKQTTELITTEDES